MNAEFFANLRAKIDELHRQQIEAVEILRASIAEIDEDINGGKHFRKTKGSAAVSELLRAIIAELSICPTGFTRRDIRNKFLDIHGRNAADDTIIKAIVRCESDGLISIWNYGSGANPRVYGKPMAEKLTPENIQSPS